MARSSGPPASSDVQPLPVSSPVGTSASRLSLHRLFRRPARGEAMRFPAAMHPEPLVRRGADHLREAVVERLGHGLGVAVRDRRLDPHLELEPVAQAQPVDRHQERTVLERHFRRRQRGGRGMAEEIEDSPSATYWSSIIAACPPALQRAQEGRDAVARAGIGAPADPFDRLHVMGVGIGVVERPVEPADVIAALVQRRARRLPVAEMGRDEDDRASSPCAPPRSRASRGPAAAGPPRRAADRRGSSSR
jgi:hypothetical protein